jgi:hypothetical protein
MKVQINPGLSLSLDDKRGAGHSVCPQRIRANDGRVA